LESDKSNGKELLFDEEEEDEDDDNFIVVDETFPGVCLRLLL
jgi:hypothetical protein